jgi:pimeloyl-ACP methyl ester carboxylesterase
MTTTTYTVPVTGLDPVEVTVTSYGSGQPFLLLHGGAGPQSVTGFAELLAAAHDAHVLVPVHPGFGGTPRPGGLGWITSRPSKNLETSAKLRRVCLVMTDSS